MSEVGADLDLDLSAEPLVGLKRNSLRRRQIPRSFSRTPRGFEASFI